MSIYSPSRNKILIITMVFSLFLHLALLKIIAANSYSTGKLFSLSGGKGKIKVSLKTYSTSTFKKKKRRKTTEIKSSNIKETAKKRKKKVSSKINTKKVHSKNAQKIPKRHKNKKQQETESNTTAVKQKEEKTTQPTNTQQETKGQKVGGSLFSFLDWKRSYINSVILRLEEKKEYPMVAREMGIQGTVKLILIVDRNGNLVNVQVAESSGFPILDENAVETAKKAKFPPFPPEVKKSQIKIPVYVIYKLTKNEENM
ncbi:energy transducer TonB [Desulfurobacterium sp.]|uniref:energy transducer TonB n=1 Tax=Desulfurobacterium sp. TaxID=2004706 RepID=UPI0026268FDA|nr:energy transducer TonB [Desulfurobacterium sp.]